MTREHISMAIGSISDKYLIEAMDGMADTVTQDPAEVYEMKTKKSLSFGRAAAIAAAACLVLSLGVIAYATDFSFADWFKGVFSGAPAQEEAYEQISADGMAACTSNGTTITPVAAIADNAMCYIRLKIDAPEGTVLEVPDNSNEFLQLSNGTYDLLVNKESGKIEPGCYTLHWEDAIPGDNSVDVVIIYSGQTGLTHFNDEKVRTVNIHGIWLQDSYKNYSVVLAGDWSFDVVFPAGEVRELDVKGLEVQSMINNEICDTAGEKVTLTQMRISPLSLEATYRFTTTDEDVIPGPGTILVVMKDGRKAQGVSGDGEDGSGWTHLTYTFNTPIAVDEVDYIQFGSQQIKVD